MRYTEEEEGKEWKKRKRENIKCKEKRDRIEEEDEQRIKGNLILDVITLVHDTVHAGWSDCRQQCFTFYIHFSYLFKNSYCLHFCTFKK